MSGFIDPKTRGKVFMLRGDISDGSPNDVLMKDVCGQDWKVLTGAGMGVVAKGYSTKHGKEVPASPGFDFASYWPSVLARERAFSTHLAGGRSAAGEELKAGGPGGGSLPRSGGGGGGSGGGDSSSAQRALARPSPAGTAAELRSPKTVPPAKAAAVASSPHERRRSLGADAAALATSLPAFLWVLGHAPLWAALRGADARLTSHLASTVGAALAGGGGTGGAAAGLASATLSVAQVGAAAAASELALVIAAMLAACHLAAVAVGDRPGRASPLGAAERCWWAASAATWTAAQLLALAITLVAADALLSRVEGGDAAGATETRMIEAVATARAWSPYFVAANTVALFTRRALAEL